jgi:hypothetical protein
MSDMSTVGQAGGGEGTPARTQAGLKTTMTSVPKAASPKTPAPATGKAQSKASAVGQAAATAARETLFTVADQALSAEAGQLATAVSARAAGSGPAPQARLASSGAAALAVEIGWTMALLFGGLRQTAAAAQDRLPTEHELAPPQRIAVEVERVNSLLGQLGKLLGPGPQPPEVPAVAPITGAVDDIAHAWKPDESSQDSLGKINLKILTWLAGTDRDLGIAYQLGRSLRDTANPPLRAPGDAPAPSSAPVDAAAPSSAAPASAAEDPAPSSAAEDALKNQLSRPKVARLQGWLSTLAPRLPADSAAIVSASMGRWCDLTSTIFLPDTPGKLSGRSPSSSAVAAGLHASLAPQGDTWLNLLVGTESAEVLLTPEGLVAAGEAALSRTARMIRKILVHYWFGLLILAVTLGVILYLTAQDLSGAGKVWTEIAAIAGTLGVTAKGVSSSMARLSKNAEKPIFGLEKVDAMAWAVTAIPGGLKLNARGVRAIRSSGIRPPGPLGRV